MVYALKSFTDAGFRTCCYFAHKLSHSIYYLLKCNRLTNRLFLSAWKPYFITYIYISRYTIPFEYFSSSPYKNCFLGKMDAVFISLLKQFSYIVVVISTFKNVKLQRPVLFSICFFNITGVFLRSLCTIPREDVQILRAHAH